MVAPSPAASGISVIVIAGSSERHLADALASIAASTIWHASWPSGCTHHSRLSPSCMPSHHTGVTTLAKPTLHQASAWSGVLTPFRIARRVAA
jgi:hypothetical protein